MKTPVHVTAARMVFRLSIWSLVSKGVSIVLVWLYHLQSTPYLRMGSEWDSVLSLDCFAIGLLIFLAYLSFSVRFLSFGRRSLGW